MVLFNTILFIDTNDVEQTGAKKKHAGSQFITFCDSQVTRNSLLHIFY